MEALVDEKLAGLELKPPGHHGERFFGIAVR
jgi:hypothetical protein